MFAQVADQVDGVLEIGEPAFGGFGQVGGSVAAQGKDVFDAVGGEILEDAVDVLQGLADAGEMGHGFEMELFLDLERHLQRPGAGAAAGAVGARGEGGAQLVEAGERVEQIGHRLVGLGRKELERDRWPRGLEDVGDFHGAVCRASVTIWQYVLNANRASSRRSGFRIATSVRSVIQGRHEPAAVHRRRPARGEDHGDQAVHASGVGQGQSEGEMGRSGGLTKSADGLVQPPVVNFYAVSGAGSPAAYSSSS